MRVRHLLLGFPLLFASMAVAQAKPKIPAFTSITESNLRAHLEFIAHDLLEGRDSPSRGLDIAAEYLAAHLKIAGLSPGGVNGTYFQPFPIGQTRISDSKSSLTISGKTFRAFDGFLPGFGAGSAKAQVVFVGHGYTLPSKEVDPYKGVDVRGKILIRVDMTPKDWNWNDYYSGKQPGSQTPEQAATARGAVGLLTIRTSYDAWGAEASALRNRVQPSMGEESFATGLVTASLSREAATALLANEVVGLEQVQIEVSKGATIPSFQLTQDKMAELKIGMLQEKVLTRNVVAILPGSDPKLKAEYIAVGAHYDHVGIGSSGSTDRIYNGADDDGSGTVANLEIARALAAGPRPKRSLIFVWHAAEEKGLWGSDYFTKNPTVPIKSIVAQLNIDMIGRSKKPGDKDPRNKDLSGPNEIYVIGSRKLSKEFGDLVSKVNNDFLKIEFDYKYDDPNDPEHFYERSDHFNYARFNIPIAFYFNGVHQDYHGVDDEVSSIDFRKIARVSRTICATAWTLANRANRPILDQKPAKS